MAEVVQADYRKLPFADAGFDAALNLYTSIGFLGDAEDVKALAEIGRVLRPGAALVIETMHRDRLVTLASDRHYELLGEGRLLVMQSTFDHASRVAQTTQALIDANNEREPRTWSIRVYTATVLAAMLERRLRRDQVLRRPRGRPARQHDAARRRRADVELPTLSGLGAA